MTPPQTPVTTPAMEEEAATKSKEEDMKYRNGYILAAINVLLDALGSVITKQYGSEMTTWEINLIRFGFAAVFMAVFSNSVYAFIYVVSLKGNSLNLSRGDIVNRLPTLGLGRNNNNNPTGRDNSAQQYQLVNSESSTNKILDSSSCHSIENDDGGLELCSVVFVQQNQELDRTVHINSKYSSNSNRVTNTGSQPEVSGYSDDQISPIHVESSVSDESSDIGSDSSHQSSKQRQEEEEVSGMEEEQEQEVEHIWYIFPSWNDMTAWQWISVSIGVVFVTFLCPAMSKYALFQMPLSLCLTLTSLGPIYSIPLVYILQGEKSGLQGIVGAFLAVGGVAIMCI